MVKSLPEFDFFFTVFLKKTHFISKIRISKITYYAALSIGLIPSLEINSFVNLRFKFSGYFSS